MYIKWNTFLFASTICLVASVLSQITNSYILWKLDTALTLSVYSQYTPDICWGMSAHPFRTVLKISCVFQLKHHSIQEHMKHSITKALNESFEVLKLILLILFFCLFFSTTAKFRKKQQPCIKWKCHHTALLIIYKSYFSWTVSFFFTDLYTFFFLLSYTSSKNYQNAILKHCYISMWSFWINVELLFSDEPPVLYLLFFL